MLKMNEAITKFEAALLCPDITELQRDTIQHWKLKIDEQLRLFLKRRDAANAEKTKAQVKAIDEKIDAAEVAATRKEFDGALDLYRDAIRMIDELGEVSGIDKKRVIIVRKIQYNDSLLTVKRQFDRIIQEADSITSHRDGNYILAFEKLEAAQKINFDPPYVDKKMSELKSWLNDCLARQCWAKEKMPLAYLYMATIENQTGDKKKALYYVKKGLRQGKMKYSPQNEALPEDIKSMAERHLHFYYAGKAEFYYEQQILARTSAHIYSPAYLVNNKEREYENPAYYIINNFHEKKDSSYKELYSKDAQVNLRSIAFRTGMFWGHKIKCGIEISAIDARYFSFKHEVTYNSDIYERAGFGGTLYSKFQAVAMLGYNFVLFRKRKLNFIPLIEIIPIAGLGLGSAKFVHNYLVDSVSEIDKQRLTGMSSIYLNLHLFSRFFLSAGYRIDTDLKPVEFTFDTRNNYLDPIKITFRHRQAMSGLSMRLIFRMS